MIMRLYVISYISMDWDGCFGTIPMTRKTKEEAEELKRRLIEQDFKASNGVIGKTIYRSFEEFEEEAEKYYNIDVIEAEV